MKFFIFSAIIILSQMNLYSQAFPPHWEANGWSLYGIRATSFDSTEVRTEIQDSTATHGLFSQLFSSKGIHFSFGSIFVFNTEWKKDFSETAVPSYFLIDYNIQEVSKNVTELIFHFKYGRPFAQAGYGLAPPINIGEWQTITIDTSTLSSFTYIHLIFENQRSDSAQEVSYKILIDNLRLVYEDTTIVLDSFGDSIIVNVKNDYLFDIPSSIILYQNYPNPFNPITTIKYEVPELSSITLKVYDVLGNEIAILVNEEKPAGNYEIQFDATAFPSGVYFYKLQAGSFVETKKMVLMK